MAEELPWRVDEPFPEVPELGTFGYLNGTKPKIISSPTELLAKLEKGSDRTIALAWTPDDVRVRPLYLIPAYQGAWVERERRLIREGAKIGWFFVILIPLGYLGASDLREFWQTSVILAVVGVLPLLSARWERRQLDEDVADLFLTRADEERFGAWLGHRPAPLGNIFAGATVALFLVPIFAPLLVEGESAIALAILDRAAFLEGEWWRGVTVAGVHGGLMHVAMNAGGGLSLAALLERFTHRGTVALVYLMAVIGGSLASALIYRDGLVVGASGGIMGLARLLLAYAQAHRGTLPASIRKDAIRSLVLTGLLGIIAWGLIDNAAHAGGLLVGYALGRWLPMPTPLEPPSDHRAIRTAGAVAVGIILSSWALTAWLVWPR